MRSKALHDQTGSATTTLVLCIPVFMLLMALVFDFGVILIVRSAMRTAADLGTLAGVQDVDLDALYQGNLTILEPQAAIDTIECAKWNLDLNAFAPSTKESMKIFVDILNPDGGQLRDTITGRKITQPTVCMELSTIIGPWVFWSNRGNLALKVHSDASMLSKKKPPK